MLKLVESCQTSISVKQHFSLKEALHKQKLSGCKNFLSLHLSDLIKMTFMASTDENHDVRLLGLEALEELVEMFKFAKEPEFEHIYLLEQYQAQVAAALSPAFGKLIDVEKISMHDNSPPPHVVAKACTVACKWLSSGVCSSLNDTQRVYRLLVGGLDRIRYEKQFVSYGFSEIARLKQVLAVLKAWSVIYVVTLGDSHVAKSLEELVAPEIPSLLPLWTDILRAATIANQPEDIGFIKIQSSLLSSLFKHGQQDNEQIVELLGNSWPVIAMGMAACPDISEQDMCMIYACVLNLLSNSSAKENKQNITCALRALEFCAGSRFKDIIIEEDDLVELMLCLERVVLTFDNDEICECVVNTQCKILSEINIQEKSSLEAALYLSSRLLVRKYPNVNIRISMVQQQKTEQEQKYDGTVWFKSFPLLLQKSQAVYKNLEEFVTVVFALIFPIRKVVNLKIFEDCLKSAKLDEHEKLLSSLLENLDESEMVFFILLWPYCEKLAAKTVKKFFDFVLLPGGPVVQDPKIKVKFLNMLENCECLFDDLGVFYVKCAIEQRQVNYLTMLMKKNPELIVPTILQFNRELDVALVTQLSQINSSLFKQQLSQIPELKSIVTEVLQSSKSSNTRNGKLGAGKTSIGAEQPKIKLKMNFTNFK